MIVRGSLSQNGSQIGKGLETPGHSSLPALRSLTDSAQWQNPARSQLAGTLKLYRNTGGRDTEQVGNG